MDILFFDRFGSMIACFQYSPINILSVRLPPATLELCGPGEQSWIKKEALEVLINLKAFSWLFLNKDFFTVIANCMSVLVLAFEKSRSHICRNISCSSGNQPPELIFYA